MKNKATVIGEFGFQLAFFICHELVQINEVIVELARQLLDALIGLPFGGQLLGFALVLQYDEFIAGMIANKYDLDFAKAAGYPDVFAHGMFVMACLGQALTDAVCARLVEIVQSER